MNTESTTGRRFNEALRKTTSKYSQSKRGSSVSPVTIIHSARAPVRERSVKTRYRRQGMSKVQFQMKPESLTSVVNSQLPELTIPGRTHGKNQYGGLPQQMGIYLESLQRDVKVIKQRLMSKEEILHEKTQENVDLLIVVKGLEEQVNMRYNDSGDQICKCGTSCSVI